MLTGANISLPRFRSGERLCARRQLAAKEGDVNFVAMTSVARLSNFTIRIQPKRTLEFPPKATLEVGTQ